MARLESSFRGNSSRLPRWLTESLSGWRLAALIFFAAFLALGLALYRDYGMGWDEQSQYLIGLINYRYMHGISQSLLTFQDRYYGPAFELLLFSLTGSLQTDQMYYARHLITFLTFALGLFGFYLLVRKLWRKDWLALAGCLAMVLSPRIFADAFYNSKDIPFMVGFIFAIYTLVRYLDHRSWLNLLLHTLATAILITIRIPGIFVAALTLGFIFLDLLLNHSQSRQKMALILAQAGVFLLAGFALMVAFWPILWHDPLTQIANAFREMSNYPANIDMLFKGFEIHSEELPLTYVPTWIAITTPLLYLAGFAAGLVNAFKNLLLKSGLLIEREKRNLLILLAWFFIPIIAVIVLRSTLYDGWRQMYFVYPALVLIALHGLAGILEFIRRIPRPKIGQAVVAGFVLLGLADPFSFIVAHHPYEYIYFNRLAGANLAAVKNLYDMDYWGLSAKPALDFILRTDPGSNIVIKGDWDPALINSSLLPPDQAKRIEFTNDFDAARYFITNYRNHPQDYPYPNEVFNVTVDGAKLVSVYRLK